MHPVSAIVSNHSALARVQPVYRGEGRGLFKRPNNDESLVDQFFEFVDDDSFPCVGAKAALARGEIHVYEFGNLDDSGNGPALLNSLEEFVAMMEACESDTSKVHSFVALFSGPSRLNELQFENMLWTQLYNLHILDVERGAPAASSISSDAASPHFSLSLAGHPFFVIGLHPDSSRMARQFQCPVLVFNSHTQFERLRADGRYAKMQKATRKRDVALQGTINPNLADFGSNSEARQYSGRKVGADWECPFNFEEARTS
ncbi:guanitoxin biosynthesis heme-dependent pre-guanitoxin N-hydroxylase GntA [Limnobacter parvus]|uniref:YqcI/YcgG family protein n=1 Tax=Limnobacter parvus TaxID=2939690 RepID=A0ABT1XGD0_9BURK|nr:guanitoxin biosynthesis heme-dependent pre-guanitoxin N-hydroxylase GntA [Limnobacter parvus]MCR2746351.1 YqcI/YcgG family protein [Limnobacter parvus]